MKRESLKRDSFRSEMAEGLAQERAQQLSACKERGRPETEAQANPHIEKVLSGYYEKYTSMDTPMSPDVERRACGQRDSNLPAVPPYRPPSPDLVPEG